MRALVATALMATGCQYMLGLENTKLKPDAPPVEIDAAIDAPPPPMVVVGDGHDGALVVTETYYTDEVRTVLTMPVLASTSTLHVGDATGFAIGDEVLIMQMAGSNAGQYETQIVQSTLSTQLLVGALAGSYEGTAQIIRVPNYTTVTIADGGVMTAHEWDGATGGVVFFRVKDRLDIQTGGKLVADGLGHPGGQGGEGGTGGPGAAGGSGGEKAQCTIGLCGNVAHGGNGLPGQIVDLLGAPGGVGVATGAACRAGDGGRGGIKRTNSEPGNPGLPGTGLGGATASDTGGSNLTASIARPVLGGGGAGGTGGASGVGGGGGGGGGGPVGQQANTSTRGNNGYPGESGGDGGMGGTGGRGGGILIVNATTIEIAGIVSARGGTGGGALEGSGGGKGGDGGTSGATGSTCNGVHVVGGQGGGGQGADGGNGGNGGAGGGGGVIDLGAFTFIAGGDAMATGGDGGAFGSFGLAGAGGVGFDDPEDEEDGAKPGADGLLGAVGGLGSAGKLFVRYVDTCTGCSGFGDPDAVVEDL